MEDGNCRRFDNFGPASIIRTQLASYTFCLVQPALTQQEDIERAGSMYSFSPQSSVYQTTKCYTTYGTMSHVDTDQLPTKGKPWSSILSRDFLHRVRPHVVYGP